MTSFPILTASAKSDRQKAELIAATDAVMGAEAAGEIANVTFKEAVSLLNRVGYDTMHALCLANLNGMSEAVQDIYYTTFYMHTVPSLLKKAEKLAGKHPLVDAVLPLLREVQPLAAAIATIKKKGLVVKRQAKPVEDQTAKYRAPSASLGAIGVVRDLLMQITEEARDELNTAIFEGFERQVATFIRKQDEANAAGKALDVVGSGVVSRVISAGPYSHAMRGHVYTLEADHKETLRQLAADMADEMRQKFVYKNLWKMDSIVTEKADLDRGEIIGRTISLGGLEGTLRFHFKDGAHFTVRNSVKWNTSARGLDFQQFPLTFHDVYLADGKKMPKPSEERMNTVFVGKEG